MYRERIKKKKNNLDNPEKGEYDTCLFSNEKENMLCKNLTANNV